MKSILAILLMFTFTFPAFADEVEILMVKATQSDSVWSFDVTVHHPDANNTHMLDSIAIFSPEEVQLSSAEIPMPSIGAENVTAKLKDIVIPEEVEYIIIRGHCSNDGWSHQSIIISLL